jgi:two-component system sensor kinase FixL
VNGRLRRVAAAVRRAARGAVFRLPGRAAEERARTSEEQLALALEASGMAIWEMDPEGGEMQWSAEAGRLFGRGPSGPPTALSDVLESLHPDDRGAFAAAIARAVASPGDLHTAQARVLWSDGTLRWVEARGRISAGPPGRGRLRGSLVDVTAVKRVEQDLRRNLEEVRVLAAVADAVATAGDEDTLLARTTALLRAAFFPDNCGFLLHDPVQGVLVHARSFHAARGRDSLAPIAVGSGVVGSVVASGLPRRIDDTAHEPAYVALEAGMRSEICVPLEVGGRLIGVFDAESSRRAAFSAEDERLLIVVASQVAGAIERLRAARTQRKIDELYRAYFTASPVALFVADARGRHLEVNAAACDLTGRSREELALLSFTDLVVPEEPGRRGGRPPSLVALGGGGEVRIRRKDGSDRHCLVHATAIDPDRLLGTLLDITERREAEERLRESEERFRSLSEASLEAIFVHDGGRVVDVNQALCDMSGYAWHELIGRDGFELIAPECRELVYRHLLAEHDRPYEIDCVRRDGTRVPVEVQARSFPYRGRVLRVVAVRDITARREAVAVRDALVHALEQKNAELERFGHNVTHDLKAPLVTIRGFADQIERDVRGGRTERLAADAERIAQAAARVQGMLDELLAVTEASRPVGPPAVVPAGDLVREALRLAAPRFAPGMAKVEVAEPLPEVYGDRARLVRVFEQLLENAFKFRSPGGEGRVRVEAGAGEPGRATLVVRDDGIGIDPRHHERVFEVFEKLDPRSDGHGVGLAVVRRIVDSHGGRVWVESKGPGEGTAVVLTLPVPPAPTDAAATERPARPRG